MSHLGWQSPGLNNMMITPPLFSFPRLLIIVGVHKQFLGLLIKYMSVHQGKHPRLSDVKQGAGRSKPRTRKEILQSVYQTPSMQKKGMPFSVSFSGRDQNNTHSYFHPFPSRNRGHRQEWRIIKVERFPSRKGFSSSICLTTKITRASSLQNRFLANLLHRVLFPDHNRYFHRDVSDRRNHEWPSHHERRKSKNDHYSIFFLFRPPGPTLLPLTDSKYYPRSIPRGNGFPSSSLSPLPK